VQFLDGESYVRYILLFVLAIYCKHRPLCQAQAVTGTDVIMYDVAK